MVFWLFSKKKKEDERQQQSALKEVSGRVDQLSQKSKEFFDFLDSHVKSTERQISVLKAWNSYFYGESASLRRSLVMLSNKVSAIAKALGIEHISAEGAAGYGMTCRTAAAGAIALHEPSVSVIGAESSNISLQLSQQIRHLEEKLEGIKEKFGERMAKLEARVEERINIFEKLKEMAAGRPGRIMPAAREVGEVRQKEQSMLKEQMLKRLARKGKNYVKGVILELLKKYGRIPALELRDIVVEEQAICSKSSFYRLVEELAAQKKITITEDGKKKMFLQYLEKGVERKVL